MRILGYYTDRYKEYAGKEYPLGPIVYEAETSQELAQLKTSMKAYLDGSRIAFINGEMSLGADWDTKDHFGSPPIPLRWAVISR